jgi:hypothetical protein
LPVSDLAFIQDDLTASGEQKCTSPHPFSHVYNVTDGKNDRCFVTIVPPTAKLPAPVLFFAHGSGGNAYRCGEGPDLTNTTWVDVAMEHNFIFMCGEAVLSSTTNNITGANIVGGIWDIPEVFNDSSGRNCDDKDSIENAYMDAIWDTLNQSVSECVRGCVRR